MRRDSGRVCVSQQLQTLETRRPGAVVEQEPLADIVIGDKGQPVVALLGRPLERPYACAQLDEVGHVARKQEGRVVFEERGASRLGIRGQHLRGCHARRQRPVGHGEQGRRDKHSLCNGAPKAEGRGVQDKVCRRQHQAPRRVVQAHLSVPHKPASSVGKAHARRPRRQLFPGLRRMLGEDKVGAGHLLEHLDPRF